MVCVCIFLRFSYILHFRQRWYWTPASAFWEMQTQGQRTHHAEVTTEWETLKQCKLHYTCFALEWLGVGHKNALEISAEGITALQRRPQEWPFWVDFNREWWSVTPSVKPQDVNAKRMLRWTDTKGGLLWWPWGSGRGLGATFPRFPVLGIYRSSVEGLGPW